MHRLERGAPIKIDGKWKDRGLSVIETLLNESVCVAAARWQSNLHGQTEHCGVPEDVAAETGQLDAPTDGEEIQEHGDAEHASPGASSVAPLDGISGAGNADLRVHARDDASSSHAGSAKRLELPQRNPYKQQGVMFRPVLGSNPRSVRCPLHKMT